MIKIGIYFLLLLTFISCSTTNQSIEETENNIDSEDLFPTEYQKTIYFPLGYPIFNVSNDEDIKLLVKEHPDFLKNYFDDFITSLLNDEYTISESDLNSNYHFLIKELTFKEFKLEVDGPKVNVALVRLDYVIQTPQKDTSLFETVTKESIPAFEESIFEDMCQQLSVKVMSDINAFIGE